MKGQSLRKAIDAHCRQCTFDSKAPGTWRQQVSLCSVRACPLHKVRPRASTIPDRVLSWYGANLGQSQGIIATSGSHGECHS